jgi:ubiquinol-cytochrome c reductase iron-sulfur subunit
MSQGEINQSRRRFLVGVTSAVGAAGAVGVATPFVKAWTPSAKAKAAGAPVKVDVSKLEMGQRLVVEWQRQPMWVLLRTKEMIDNLPKMDSLVADPTSKTDQQPVYAKNEHRSRDEKPEILVLAGTCTHLGCSPTYRPEVHAEDLGGDSWLGGFFCPCHGSKFDLAGRVFKGSPAPINLLVPPYYYESDTVLVIGANGKGEV